MPLHSVDALLDRFATAEVRREWDALAAAGLPSQARIRGDANTPHVTLSVASGIPDFVVDRIASRLGDHLPLPVRLGGVVVLGSRRFVVARLVVPDSALLTLHACVAEAMDACPEVPDPVRVGRWTPHVTLARGLGSRQVGDAMAVLGRTRPVDGAIEAVRRWNPVTRRIDDLTAPAGG
jgi:2'-5' RNA ligase